MTEPRRHPDSSRAAMRIEAALLHAESCPVPEETLLRTLNEIMGPAELTFAERDSGDGLLLSAGRLHLRVAACDGPLPAARTKPALASRLPQILGEDWRGAVKRHTAAITLAAGLGPDPHTLPTLDPARMREAQDLMRTVVHVAASFLAGCDRPLAVLWDGSEQLFGPDRFLAMADMLDPLPLYLHPRPILGPRGVEAGFELVGAEALIGTALRMEPADEPFGWLVGRALSFVAHALEHSGPLPVGDSFGLAAGERFEIAEADGGLSLRLVEHDGVTRLPAGGGGAAGKAAA